MLSVNLAEAVGSLMGSKQRTFLALLGVIIGIGSVMAMLTIGATIKAEALRQFRQMGTDVITLRPGVSGGGGGEPVFSLELADLLAKYSKHLRLMSPEVKAYAKVSGGKSEISCNVHGVRDEFFTIKRLSPARGRLLSFLDHGHPFVLLGAALEQKLAKTGVEIPIRRISIKGQPFEVVGVLAPASLGFRSQEVDGSVFVPLDMAARLKSGGGLSLATVQILPESDHGQAQAELKKLAAGFGTPPGGLETYSPRQMLEQMEKQMGLYTLLLAAVGSISLVVGGVGIMNMMLVSVTERKREIGIRRALGARKGDISSQFLVESIILSLTGGVMGSGLGVAAGYVVARMQNVPLIFSPGAMGLCLAVALGVGLFFGYYPARKAAGMDVIMALKAE